MRQTTRVRLTSLVVCLALATVWTFLAVPEAALAEKPPNAGGGGIIAVNVTLIDDGLNLVSSDGGTYFDGLEMVMAISDDGFRFDTDGTDKMTHRNQVRYVNFDFTGTTFDPKPDFPPATEPGVDAHMDHETNSSGVPLGTGWLGLVKEVGPGETKYAEYYFNFGFMNSDGVEEKWQLAYGTPPGLDPATDLPLYGLPVKVVGSEDDDGDEKADSWTITGTVAGLRRLRVGKKWSPVYIGQDNVPFTMVVERQ